jgi:hypothetical protein
MWFVVEPSTYRLKKISAWGGIYHLKLWVPIRGKGTRQDESQSGPDRVRPSPTSRTYEVKLLSALGTNISSIRLRHKKMITTRRQHLIKLCTTMQNSRASSSSSSSSCDPRKARETSSAVVAKKEGVNLPLHQSRNEVGPPLNNNYQQHHPPSTLGMLGSYVMAGVGVALGVTLVSALFGAIGWVK